MVVEEFTDYDSVVVFSAVGYMRLEQNFSSFHIDTCLVGRNAISKNANNVVISSLRFLIFSQVLDPDDSFLRIWSRDQNYFRFGRQGAPIFFSNSIFSATVQAISEMFSGSCASRRALLKFWEIWGRGSNLEARPPKANFSYFFLWYLSRIVSSNFFAFKS